MKTHKLTATRCPWCGHRHDAAVNYEIEDAPKPGDLTICISCASLLKFDESIVAQKIGEDERRQAIREQPDLAPAIERAQRAVRSLDRRDATPGKQS